MNQLLKYSFSKMYFFYRDVLCISHNTYLYPSAITGFLLAFNVLAALSGLLMILDYSVSFYQLYSIGGVLIVFLTIIYIRIGRHYKKIIKDVQGYTEVTLNRLKINIIIYTATSLIIAVLSLFFLI